MNKPDFCKATASQQLQQGQRAEIQRVLAHYAKAVATRQTLELVLATVQVWALHMEMHLRECSRESLSVPVLVHNSRGEASSTIVVTCKSLW